MIEGEKNWMKNPSPVFSICCLDGIYLGWLDIHSKRLNIPGIFPVFNGKSARMHSINIYFLGRSSPRNGLLCVAPSVSKGPPHEKVENLGSKVWEWLNGSAFEDCRSRNGSTTVRVKHAFLPRHSATRRPCEKEARNTTHVTAPLPCEECM